MLRAVERLSGTAVQSAIQTMTAANPTNIRRDDDQVHAASASALAARVYGATLQRLRLRRAVVSASILSD
jgi:hypothetical protein